MPEPLAAVGALADEFLADDPVDDVPEHEAAPLVVGLTHRAVVRRDPQDGRRSFRSRPAETVPPSEGRRDRREGN